MLETLTYADWLRETRTAAGLTQDQLGDATGIHRTYILKLEKPGHVKLPKYETRQKVHAVFGTTDDDLRALGILDGPSLLNDVPARASPPIEEGSTSVYEIASALFRNLTPEVTAAIRALLDAADLISLDQERPPRPTDDRRRQDEQATG